MSMWEGIVFELARFYDLKIYTGFDINLLTLHLYEKQKDYEYHCRTPDEKYISKIFRSKIYNQEALDFAKRDSLESKINMTQKEHFLTPKKY